MVIYEELNTTIIDYHPILILPETSFVDVLKKLAMGYEYLIVVDGLLPLGVIYHRQILKIIVSNINIYSLRAKNFCESFPSEKKQNLPDIFTIAQNIYERKYIIYGCLNSRGNLTGIITAKSLCRYFDTESFYQQISLEEVIEPNLNLVKNNTSLLSIIESLSTNDHLQGLIFETDSGTKVASLPSFISTFINLDGQIKVLDDIEIQPLKCLDDTAKITTVSKLLEENSSLLINHYFSESIINSCAINQGISSKKEDNFSCFLPICNRLNLVTAHNLIKVLTPPWQHQYLRRQQ
jgi:CBS domain-containing protein